MFSDLKKFDVEIKFSTRSPYSQVLAASESARDSVWQAQEIQKVDDTSILVNVCCISFFDL